MDEKKIIRRCRKHDVDAFKMLYDRYGQPLLSTARRMLGQQQDAEDAVQTAFLKLYRNIHTFRHDSTFSTYLFRILINVCFDLIRKRERMRAQTLNVENPALKSCPELRLCLEEAIQSLPDRMRACFVLHAVEGIKQDEIAGILNISIGGVKSNIFHAKSRLRELLKATDSSDGVDMKRIQ